MYTAVRRLLRGGSLSALELFAQVQIGTTPSLSISRQFIVQHFAEELPKRKISHAKLLSMDARQMAQLLKQLFYDRYLAVPFRLFTFDLEFTATPRFTSKGPTEEVIELAFFHPDTGELYEAVCKPEKKVIDPETEKLTGISKKTLRESGVKFEKAWKGAMNFISKPRINEHPDAASRILLVSHGGKLADVSMLQWSVKNCGQELPKYFCFGDSYHVIRDIHRKRPVTPDRHPPSWGLEELSSWMKLPEIGKAHRAGVDAKVTWQVLERTLTLYGHETLEPKQQLVSRFFDETAKSSFAKLGEVTEDAEEEEGEDPAAEDAA